MENKGESPKQSPEGEGPKINVPKDSEQKAAEKGEVSDEQEKARAAMAAQIEARRLSNLEKTQKDIDELRNLF